MAAARGVDPEGLRRQLENDLDWILLKALEKDPGLRYQTADALANDLHRHLSHLPVEAACAEATLRAGRSWSVCDRAVPSFVER